VDGLPAVRSFAFDEVLGPVSSTVRAHGPCESSTPATRVQSRSVPELPDLAVVADAFHAALAGRPITTVRSLMPLTIRGTPAELEALVGQSVVRVARVGKFLDLDLSRDRVVVNPMLTGRFQLAGHGEKAPSGTALEIGLGSRKRQGRRTGTQAAAWTAGAAWLPEDGAPVVVRYRDPTQMGKVYLLPAGVERPVPGRGPGEMGPDALDPELTLDAWRERIRRHPGELKNLLRNQAFVAGIGNAYSDEILFQARLQPFRKRSSLAPEEVDALYAAMRSTLETSVLLLRERVPPTFEKQVRDQLAVHNRGGQPCPRCGAKVTEVRAGGFPTGYCRGCQR
jgi:formamidopyrimidine-DNA glycosylase